MFAMVCILLGCSGVVRNNTYLPGYQDGTVRTVLYDVIASVGRVQYRTVRGGIVPYGKVDLRTVSHRTVPYCTLVRE
jgi:hypothetical protein